MVVQFNKAHKSNPKHVYDLGNRVKSTINMHVVSNTWYTLFPNDAMDAQKNVMEVVPLEIIFPSKMKA